MIQAAGMEELRRAAFWPRPFLEPRLDGPSAYPRSGCTCGTHACQALGLAAYPEPAAYHRGAA